MKKIIYLMALCLLVFQSCKKEEVAGGTAVQDMAGEWWVQVQIINTADGSIVQPYSDDYSSISTYNTSDNNPSEMWMDDAKSYYGLKAKVKVDYVNKTFTATDAPELYFGVTVTIKNGKIIKDGAIGPVSKDVTDAISYDAIFSDDATHTYQFKGYHRTKFSGDDH
jgi:hypothetical protein